MIVEGHEGRQAGDDVAWELVDRYDEKHGISAMMRTTGYSLSITGQMQARGEIKPAGVHTPDECMPAEQYIAELAKRGVEIQRICRSRTRPSLPARVRTAAYRANAASVRPSRRSSSWRSSGRCRCR